MILKGKRGFEKHSFQVHAFLIRNSFALTPMQRNFAFPRTYTSNSRRDSNTSLVISIGITHDSNITLIRLSGELTQLPIIVESLLRTKSYKEIAFNERLCPAKIKSSCSDCYSTRIDLLCAPW